MAILANQTIYLGASFSPFFMLMCMADLCKYKIKMPYQIVMMLFGGFLVLLTSTIGKFDWYYKEINFVIKNEIREITKVYGPLHVIYPIYLILIVVVCVAMIVKAIRTKKDVSYATSTLLLFASGINIFVYIFEKLSHLPFSILPISYLITQVFIIILLNRISMYDVSFISAGSLAENYAFGFVIFDKKGRYLGCDEAAKQWFPEIKELRIEQKIEGTTDFLKQILIWINDEENNKLSVQSDTKSEDKRLVLKRDEYYIEMSLSVVKEKKNKTIYCIYLRDDTQQQQYTKLVEQYNEDLEKAVDRKTKKLKTIQNDITISMASIVENRDNNTGGHIARTSDIIEIFIKHLRDEKVACDISTEMAECIIKAAPLHDLGKIAIPDIILNKPGKFTEAEYDEMKTHAAKGAVIVAGILKNSEDEMFKNIAINIAHFHHEKWDGNGYPDNLKGEEIPFEARVMALADVFDALVSKRIYKESYSYDTAFKIIEESCGTHFDPMLCKEFLDCRNELEALYDAYED